MMNAIGLRSVAIVVLAVVMTACSGGKVRRDGSTALVSVSKDAYRRGIKICIDAGHGGEDYGTRSKVKPRTHEKFLALATAFMVRDTLERMGYQTVMTRSTDVFVPLSGRVAFAASNQANLFVSVHYNSAPNEKAHGIEVFYYNAKKPTSRTLQSQKFAEAVLLRTLMNTKANSRGVKHGDFAVVRETGMPAILVEGGFLTNIDELQYLKDPTYLNRIARGVAFGVDDYVKQRYQGQAYAGKLVSPQQRVIDSYQQKGHQHRKIQYKEESRQQQKPVANAHQGFFSRVVDRIMGKSAKG